MPDFKKWFEKGKLPIAYDSMVEDLVEKNSQRINFDAMDKFFLRDEGIQIDNFFKLLVEEILKSNPEAFGLFKNLCVINTDLPTNINRKCVAACYDLPDVEKVFDELVDTGLLIKKVGSGLEFEYPPINVLLKLSKAMARPTSVLSPSIPLAPISFPSTSKMAKLVFISVVEELFNVS